MSEPPTLSWKAAGQSDIEVPGAFNYYLLDVVLTIRAGHAGIFPEVEFICWLRAVLDNPGKMLVVEPVEPIDAVRMEPRSFRASESRIALDRVAGLVRLFRSAGYPARCLETQDTSDPESMWWAVATLDVTLDDESRSHRINLGPDGVRGTDASILRSVFHALLALAELKSCWSDLLTGEAHEGA